MPGHITGLSPQIHRGPDPGRAALHLRDSALFAEDRRAGHPALQPVPARRFCVNPAIRAEKAEDSHCLDWAGKFRILAAGWGTAERQVSANESTRVSPFSRPKMTMRIATTLMLGAALLAGAAADAQETKSVPAVPPRQGLAVTRTAAAQPASGQPVSRITSAGPAVPATTKPDAAKPGSAKSEADAPPDAGIPDAAAPVQEAKNNDAAVIDAANPDTGNDSDSVVATVNDESISDFELRQRMALYLALQGGGVTIAQLTPEQKPRMRGQILDVLEAEKLQLQEAVKKKITVSPVEVDRRLNGMIQDYHFTIDQLRQNLKNAGSSEDALRSQITASIAWLKAVQDEYGDQVNITPEMVTAELQRNAEGANKAHYHVLEIFLPVDNPEQNEKVKKEAEEVGRQLKQGAPFPVVARQFSQHPTAATGGDMGRISDGQMAPELNTALNTMQVGSISEPICSTGGWYIIA